MKNIYALLLALFCWCTLARAQVNIIFDTDIAPDYDDVGAMAMLHAYADAGKANILATISCNTFPTTVPTLSVLNTYFGRPTLPIGVTKGNFPNKDCSQQWAEALVANYPHALRSNADAEEAVGLYRRLLASQPDSSVTIVTVGFFTNLANLLSSAADAHSPLSGTELVKKKVKLLVSMAARLNSDNKGSEFNVVVDAASSQRVFRDWPTPWIVSGFEIGEKVLTGIRLTGNNNIRKSPVKDAYAIALTKDSNQVGRNSWDQTAVLVAVEGIAPWFTTRLIDLTIAADGTNALAAGKRIAYLQFRQPPNQVRDRIEALMMHQPK